MSEGAAITLENFPMVVDDECPQEKRVTTACKSPVEVESKESAVSTINRVSVQLTGAPPF